MAGTNTYLQWNPSQNNQKNFTAYQADTQRQNGAASGDIFPSPTANKLFYQLSTMCGAIAAAMAAKGYNIDDTQTSNMIATMGNLITNNDVPGKLVQWTEAGQFLK